MTLFAPVAALLVAFAATAAPWRLVRRLDRDDALGDVDRLVVSFLLGCLGLYLSVTAIAWWRLDGLSMGAILVVWLAAGLAGTVAMPWRQWRRWRLQDPISAVLAASCALVAGLALIQGMAPPNDFDSLLYHLAFPKADLERGHLFPLWDRGMPHAFFPALTGHLYRLTMAVSGDGAAQMMTGLFGIAAALSTRSLALRADLGNRTAWLAALLFLSIRMVVWEMATAEVEVALTAYAVAAMTVLTALRRSAADTPLGLGVLLGLILAGGVLVKFHGVVIAIGIALPVLWDMARRRLVWWLPLVILAAALVPVAPHIDITWSLTGNPAFPLFNEIFTANGIDLFSDLRQQYGTGRGLVDLLVAPWHFSVNPLGHFDGMVLGAPVLLALAPLAILRRRFLGALAAMLTTCGFYYLMWFYSMSQQVRFLMPILPVVAVMASVGAGTLWHLAGQWRWGRAVTLPLLLALAANQAMFVGVYAALRLPVALGLTSASAYHSIPSLTGAHYDLCRWVSDRLPAGERILSELSPHSYYCPQAAAVTGLFPEQGRVWLHKDGQHSLTSEQFVALFKSYGFRFVIVPLRYESRRNSTAEIRVVTIDPSQTQYGLLLAPYLSGLQPLFATDLAAIYDGHAILKRMEATPPR